MAAKLKQTVCILLTFFRYSNDMLQTVTIRLAAENLLQKIHWVRIYMLLAINRIC